MMSEVEHARQGRDAALARRNRRRLAIPARPNGNTAGGAPLPGLRRSGVPQRPSGDEVSLARLATQGVPADSRRLNQLATPDAAAPCRERASSAAPEPTRALAYNPRPRGTAQHRRLPAVHAWSGHGPIRSPLAGIRLRLVDEFGNSLEAVSKWGR